MAYTPAGHDVAVDLGALAGGSAQPWWFDPRTGEANRLDAVEGGGTVAFTPPATDGDEADWVLVVDDAGAGLGAPGTGRGSGPERGPGTAPETGASGQDLDDPAAEVAPGSADGGPAAPRPAALPPADSGPSPAAGATADAVWDRLAQCESSGDWGIARPAAKEPVELVASR